MSRGIDGSGIALGFWLLALAPAVGFAARQQSRTPAPMVDVETVGPKVGDALPDFSLRDQGGHIQSLKSLLGPKGAVVVFFRSADW
jgi:cytochrome oxidase Cu insertion factor (SCO1/SenC/PrrC family)